MKTFFAFVVFTSMVILSVSVFVLAEENSTTDSTPPVVLSASPSGTVKMTFSEIVIKTDEPATCSFSNSRIPYDSMTKLRVTGTTSHLQEVTLAANKDYTYFIKCKDVAGNIMQESFKFGFDTHVGRGDSYCTDTDGGIDYYKKGIITSFYNPDSVYDGCRKDNELNGAILVSKGPYLLEVSCDFSGNRNFNFEYYKCENGCVDGACVLPQPPTDLRIKERITCLFDGAEPYSENSCYASGKDFSCKGVTDCLADVKDVKGQKITWKSSCGGYKETIADGEDETITFDCSNSVKEEVTCYFENANTDAEQECYAFDAKSGCKGVSQCQSGVYATTGKQITWKSSCGGYQYTTQDGSNEKVIFECAKGEINGTQVEANAFRNAYWQCYDGKQSFEGNESSCKSSGLWKKYASEFCQFRCSSGKEKCGISSFALSNSCYSEDETVYLDDNKNNEAKAEPILEEKFDAEMLICKDSCPLDNKCYPFGYRKSDKFCADSGAFGSQLQSDAQCENNFECTSNVCVSNKCVSQGFIDRVMSWFKRLFGGN